MRLLELSVKIENNSMQFSKIDASDDSIELKRSEFEAELQLFNEKKQQLDQDRKKFTEAAIKIGRERAQVQVFAYSIYTEFEA
jgi:HD-like signal output (HDOD) protein